MRDKHERSVEFHDEVLIEFVEIEVFRDFVAFLHIILHQHEATLVGLKLRSPISV